MALGLLRGTTEARVSNRTLGLVMTVVGSALGAWWLASQRQSRTTVALTAPREHGTVIFHNTPTAAETDAILS
jgi:hypothetical protein